MVSGEPLPLGLRSVLAQDGLPICGTTPGIAPEGAGSPPHRRQAKRFAEASQRALASAATIIRPEDPVRRMLTEGDSPIT
jgi:hypothetical protein